MYSSSTKIWPLTDCYECNTITMFCSSTGSETENPERFKFSLRLFNWWEVRSAMKQYISHFRVYINWWTFNCVAFVLIDSRACWPVNWHLKSCLNWYGSADCGLALSWLMSLFTVSGVIVAVTSLKSASPPPFGPGFLGLHSQLRIMLRLLILWLELKHN